MPSVAFSWAGSSAAASDPYAARRSRSASSRSAWSLARRRVSLAALRSDAAGAHSSRPVRAHPARSSVSARLYSWRAPRSSPRATRASASCSRSPATCRAATRWSASLNVRNVTWCNASPVACLCAMSSVCSARRRSIRVWEGSVRPKPRHASKQASRRLGESGERRTSSTPLFAPFFAASAAVRRSARKWGCDASSAPRSRRFRCARSLRGIHAPSSRRSQPPPNTSDIVGAPPEWRRWLPRLIYPLTGTRRAPIAPLRVTEFPVWRLGHTLDRLTDAHRVVVNFGRQDDHPRAMLHVRQGTSPTRPRDPSARRPDLPAPSRGGKIPEGGEIGPAFSPFCPSAPAPRPTRGVSPTRRKLAPLHRRR